MLIAIVALFAATGSSLTDLLGRTSPPADQFDVRRVEFEPGEISVLVTNPQADDLTIATVTVDDAIVPYTDDGDSTLGLEARDDPDRGDWVLDEPLHRHHVSSSGIQTTHEVAAAVETPTPSPKAFSASASSGCSSAWSRSHSGCSGRSLRRARPEWLAAFMALTAGLLSFLALEALSEAFALQAALPSALGGAGVVLLGFVVSYLTLTYLSHKLAALATLVAIGIGRTTSGRAAGSTSFAFGELALGLFLIIGFDPQERHRRSRDRNSRDRQSRVSFGRLALLVLIAGAPAILGTASAATCATTCSACCSSRRRGAAFEVVIEVGRWLRTAPGGLTSGWVLGGFLAGVSIMYVTGVLAG